jgi:hypothetical protein
VPHDHVWSKEIGCLLLLMLIVIDLSIGVGHLAAAPVVKKECRAK